MRYKATIKQPITIPMVVEASSEAEAVELVTQRLLNEFPEYPETVGDPITEAPRVRSVRKPGG